MSNDYSESYSDLFVKNFSYNVNFYCDFLSRKLKLIKFNSAYYRFISIELMKDERQNQNVFLGENASVTVGITNFDKDKYVKMDMVSKYNYYMSLVETGCELLSKQYSVPLKAIQEINSEFINNGYRNERKKVIRVQNSNMFIRASGEFTTKHFEFKIDIYDGADKLCSGTLFKTMPNEIFFNGVVKYANSDRSYITFFNDLKNPIFRMKIEDVTNGIFNPECLAERDRFWPWIWRAREL